MSGYETKNGRREDKRPLSLLGKNIEIKQPYLSIFLAASIAFFLAPILISVLLVDEYIGLDISENLRSASCNVTYVSRKSQLLNPIDFYMHMDYWLADSRLPDSYLIGSEESRCLVAAIAVLAREERGASLAFVSPQGTVTAIFETK